MYCYNLHKTLMPFSMLHVTNVFNRMAQGEIMEIVVDDLGAEADLRRILPPATCEITVVQEPTEAGDRQYRLRLHKKAHGLKQPTKETHHDRDRS